MAHAPLLPALVDAAVLKAERMAVRALSDPAVSDATKASLRRSLLTLQLSRLEELDTLLGSLSAGRGSPALDTKGTPNV